MYKSVYDLTRDQLNELKTLYFYSDDPDISENLTAGGIECAEDIPDDVIFHNYESVVFVDDDFFL